MGSVDMDSVDNDNINQADVFEAVADAIPGSKALTIAGRTMSYQDLDEESTRMAHLLQEAGVEAGTSVAMHMRNSIEHMCGILGAMKIRAASININYRYTKTELAYLYKDSGCVASLIDAEFGEALAMVIPQLSDLKSVLCVGEAPSALKAACDDAGISLIDVESAWPAQSPVRDFDKRSGDDRMILYTGGTTGSPKGVVWRSADYYFACLSGGNPYGDSYQSPEEVAQHAPDGSFMSVVLSAPLVHGAGTFTVLTFLNFGAHLILQRDFDPIAVLRDVEKHKATALVFVGDGMAVPITDAMVEHKDSIDVSSLFAVSSGGGIWSKASREKLLTVLPNAMLLDSFGASESGNDGALAMDDEGAVHLQPGPTIDVLNEDFQQVAPGSDEIGYIVRKGHIPLGYHNDPEKTERTFPVVDGVRMSVLGDMGRIAEDGTIVFLGRGSGCINTGGEKVFPEEVEQALKSHPAVFDALVTGAPDERYGEVVAAVVHYRDDEEEPSEEELRSFLAENLARYKLPRRVVVSSEIKRSPAGKADYRWAKSFVESA